MEIGESGRGALFVVRTNDQKSETWRSKSFRQVPRGAEIRQVDLAAPMHDLTFAAMERAYKNTASSFSQSEDKPKQQVAFTRRFGEIEYNAASGVPATC